MAHDPVLTFISVPSTLIEGAPPAWGASAFPWTFVVTQIGETRYAASARRYAGGADVGDNQRINLGSQFTTFVAACEACSVFLRQKRG